LASRVFNKFVATEGFNCQLMKIALVAAPYKVFLYMYMNILHLIFIHIPYSDNRALTAKCTVFISHTKILWSIHCWFVHWLTAICRSPPFCVKASMQNPIYFALFLRCRQARSTCIEVFCSATQSRNTTVLSRISCHLAAISLVAGIRRLNSTVQHTTI